MKTLYINRPLVNGQALLDWAQAQGFKVLMPANDLHVTLAFSKTPVDWDTIQKATDATSVPAASEGRIVEPLGDQGAVVLRFNSDELKQRWQELVDLGAKWDWPEYKSHVSFTYDGRGVDLSKVVPYDGPLDFGPEQMKEVDPDWVAKVKEKQTTTQAQDSIAFDKASVRKIDQDGHLSIEMNPISKSNICEYRGNEIPGADELGLEPDKLYRLFRDPEALKAGAPTAAGKPIMLIHKPINADDHPREVVVGAIGTDVKFEFPYLKAPLTIWDGEAIKLIEEEEQRELSLGYRYKPDMTPGNFEGEAFDGRMLEIAVNHLSLVHSGRVGGDVFVYDSALTPQLKELFMTKVKMSGRALQTHGAIAGFLVGKLAQDAKIDLGPVVKDLTNKNFKAKKKDLIASITTLTNGKLAQDASLADLDKFLDAMGGSDVPEATDPEAVDAEVTDPNAAFPEKKEPTVDGDPCAQLLEFLKGKGMSDEDVAAACAMMKPAEAVDENPNKMEEKDGGAMDKEGPEMKPDMVSKKDMATAMDAAIKKVTEANDKRQQELRAAERAVKPYVGELAMDHKTANEVYAATLTALGVEGIADVHPSAYPAILKAIPLPNQKNNNVSAEVAMDAAAINSYDKMFPDAGRIGNV